METLVPCYCIKGRSRCDAITVYCIKPLAVTPL